MKVLAWNCRGLRSADSPTIPFLGWLVRQCLPQILFLSETKSDSSLISKLAMYLGFPNVATVDSINNAGGLALFWSNDVNLDLKVSSTNYFACNINDLVDEDVYIWNLILLYGSPYLDNRGEVWERIADYISRNPLDSVIMGDFNQIEFLNQKMGGSTYIPGKETFSQWRDQLGLSEINFQGQNFTWCNNRSEPERVYERLDRAYATEDWLHRYSEARILNMPILISDHSPILLISSPIYPKKKSTIKMESWCLDFKEVEILISKHWKVSYSGSPMYEVAQKCKSVRYKLFQWCKNYKSENNINWEEFLSKCGEIQANLPISGGGKLDEEIKDESIRKLEVQLKFWQQRVKCKWKAWEDTNSRWFFRKAKRRKQKNEILVIKNSAGKWVSSKQDIQGEFLGYFADIFQGSQHSQEYWEELDGIRHLIPQIDLMQREDLIKPVTREEVRNVVFQMGSLKAPGPDGIPAIFYQKHWSIVGEDIWRAVSHFFTTGYILQEWNQTNICLIPKVERPEQACQFRPISLCNVIYKIISKIIANRLKPILKSIVTPYQNAFVPGRLISDNCLIAHEVVNLIKQRKKGTHFLAALKIDMFKAYDKVDWDFLFWLLTQMGFPSFYRQWIMQCVTTVSYSIIVNGEPTTRFKPSCGLRQGDPLSSYLFILIMDVLSRLLIDGVSAGSFQGIKLSRSSPVLSHLFFADDSLIFFKATPTACAGVKDILARFSRLSGEVINYNKSHIMFSPNTPLKFKRYMRSIVGTPSEESLGKYLGCNIEVDGRSSRKFQPLVEKVERKVSSWQHLTLSHAGRVIFINNILSMLSLNILSVFLIPKSTADKINAIFARFLWANPNSPSPIFWKSRKIIEMPKGGGGLGIRNVHLFNKALLAKQAIRIHNSRQSLISQVLLAKYKASPVDIVLRNRNLGRVSWGMRGLCRAVQDCRAGFTSQIGNGSNTSIVGDKWIREGPVIVKSGVNLAQMGIRQVKDLMNTQQKTWNSSLIWKCFHPDTAMKVLATHIPVEDLSDIFVWSESKSGVPRVKDIYAFYLLDKGELNTTKENRQFWNKFWASDLLPKWKFFTWRLLNKALATSSNLRKRNILIQEMCSLCKQDKENESHLFRDCNISRHVWASSLLGIRICPMTVISIEDWIKNFLKLLWKEDGVKSPRVSEFIATLWAIWIHRNNVIFRSEEVNPVAIMNLKIALLKEIRESSKFRDRNNPLSHIENSRLEGCHVSQLDSTSDKCIVKVDGAWKRHKQKNPRAGIGWSALLDNSKIFEGNDVVISLSSLQTEAHAVLRGLREAFAHGVNRVHICSDSRVLVQALHNRQYPFEVASIAHDIQAMCNKFLFCKIQHVGRDVVAPAHALATAARLGNLI
uniref:Reverse transcriptase domain-containing protein n=1 Tax=Beta vulgaris subsp. vulgaris TaxID=3555 RepID=F4NCH8_BETVV|nr:hypothetical protein [Beta vulgaris subsp. vulgaris]